MDLDAPLSYDQANELSSDGCAVVIMIMFFPLGKWGSPPLPAELDHDHDQIVDFFTNEFIERTDFQRVVPYSAKPILPFSQTY
jgi:hypothetical protein